jgi:hypothetical protein
MKKLVVGLTVVTLLAIGVIAYAHDSGWYGGGHRGSSYGYHMMDPGYSGHMRGWTGENDQKFLDESADARKELNDKKFEYFEAVRNPKTTTETLTKLERDIRELEDKIYQKAPRDTYRGFTRHCWEY